MNRMLVFLALFVAVLVVPTVTWGQDGPTNPVTMGHGPEEGTVVPAWIFYWLLGVGTVISGSLVAAIKVLWGKLNKDVPGLTEEERTWLKTVHDTAITKDQDGVLRIYTPTDLKNVMQKLEGNLEKALEKLSEIIESKEERKAMRAAFGTEKAQMREIYTSEIKDLQARLTQEQQERREETKDLWTRNDNTTREVMTVIRDMIITLQNAANVIEHATQVIEQYAEEEEDEG